MNVLRQSDIDYQKQLRQIACKVDSHIVNNPGELQNFRNRIKPLAKRWKDYFQAGLERKQALLEHWELIKKNSKLQDKNSKSFEKKGYEWDRFYLLGLDSFGSNPINEMPAKYAPDVMFSLEKYLERNKKNEQKYPKNSSEYKRLQETIAEQRQNLEDIRSEFDTLSPAGQKTAWIKTPPKTVIPNKTYVKFTWWRYLNLDDELVFGCWRPELKPLPENPLDRLKPTDEEYHSKQRELQTLPIARDEAEEFERYYIFLSFVHDKYLPEVESITKNIWSDDLKKAVWGLCDIFFGDKTAFLNSALEHIKADLARKKATETENIELQEKDGQAEPLKEPAKAKPDSALARNINIQNFQGILGDVQTENVQTGDYTSICKHDGIEKKKKGIIKKLFGIIAAVVIFLAALLTCLYYLGWLEPFKELIYRIFLHN